MSHLKIQARINKVNACQNNGDIVGILNAWIVVQNWKW